MDTLHKSTILVIVGITGDLSKRKLLPAIEQILTSGAIDPDDFEVIGITRQALTISDIVLSKNTFLVKNLSLHQMNLAEIKDYHAFKKIIDNKSAKNNVQILYYLSVPPQVSGLIVNFLGEAGLNSNAKLLLEKPFGTDLESAKDLVRQTKHYFEEDQIYRIDHYLAKEMSQNLIVFREQNSLFKRTWNHEFIENITIVASEKIGIEGRASFYEQTGALRDLVQSHLLQLAALTLMKLPSNDEDLAIPKRRLTALKQLYVHENELTTKVKRGQYIGYEHEAKNPGSTVETFVDITLHSKDAMWRDVPIRLVTGKALSKKTTEICITYRKDKDHEANQLRIKLQPDEGIELALWAKVPGYDWRVSSHPLRMSFKDKYENLPEAYEKVIVDAIHSDHSLFASSDEVLETWRILEPIRQKWEQTTDDMIYYPQGSQDIEGIEPFYVP